MTISESFPQFCDAKFDSVSQLFRGVEKEGGRDHHHHNICSSADTQAIGHTKQLATVKQEGVPILTLSLLDIGIRGQ